jgi:hypothetical protein
MKKIENAVRNMWVGVHPKLGPLIYDEGAQLNLGENEIRLWKIKEQRSAVFVKSIVRNKLENPDEKTAAFVQLGVAIYVSIMGKRRVTHCFACKRHLDSVDFGLCEKCRWIRM